MSPAGLLLAAGAGTRFGGPKALVRLQGETLAERGVRLLRSGGCAPVLVVVGAQAAHVTTALPDGVQVVVADEWAAGMGASLRAGLAALERLPGAALTGTGTGTATGTAQGTATGTGTGTGTGTPTAAAAATAADGLACVVALVDQPLVGPQAVQRLVAAWHGGAEAAVATYGGRPRNPVLLGSGVWGEVAAAAAGDAGARAWLRRHPERVVPVPCDGTGRPDDVDVPDDLIVVRALLLGGPVSALPPDPDDEPLPSREPRSVQPA